MAPANGNIVMRFGQTVRRIRLKQGLSQERYAELAEVHRNYVGLIERGERSPTLSNLVRLANGLGISLSELLRRAQL
jgi:transcriptional regulator with XRE-family HTH domain